jgi:hypothetical protein
MTTNFPTSVDSFPDPLATDRLDNPPHDVLHTNVNSAVEAIETALLDGAPLHIDDVNERVGIGTTTPESALEVNGILTANHIHGNIAGAVYLHVKNTSGVTIPEGSPVYATGSVGASGATEVAISDADNASTMPALGIVDAELVANADGHATVLGVAKGLDTSAWSVNDSLYVSTSGGLTNVRPTGASELVQKIGRVVRADASTGEVLVLGAGRSNDVPNNIVAGGLTVDTDTLHVDSANNRVGIGTTTPSVKLEVSGDILLDDGQSVYIGSTSTGAHRIRLHHSTNGSAYVDYKTNLFFRPDGQNSNNVILDSSGNVGIGTTNPAYKLDAKGQVQIGADDNITPDANGNGHLMIDGAGYTGFASLDGTAMWVGHNSGGRSLYLATDETARLAITGGGNVGIGTTSPGSKLDVNGGTSSVSLRVNTTNADPALVLTTLGQQDWSIGVDYSDAGKLKFSESTDVGNTTRMAIDSSGNVGIGTTGPQTPLHVQRGTGVSAGNYSGDFAALIYHAVNGSTKHSLLVLNNWMADASTLIEAGSINASNGAYTKRFYVNGLGRSYNFYGTWGTISDQTLKTDIVDAANQLDDILGLRFVNYKFIEDVERDPETAPRLFGLIAQEVEQVSPGLVTEDGEGIKTVNTSVLSMKAVKAMQEMHAIVESQQTIISDLTARIEALEEA